MCHILVRRLDVHKSTNETKHVREETVLDIIRGKYYRYVRKNSFKKKISQRKKKVTGVSTAPWSVNCYDVCISRTRWCAKNLRARGFLVIQCLWGHVIRSRRLSLNITLPHNRLVDCYICGTYPHPVTSGAFQQMFVWPVGRQNDEPKTVVRNKNRSTETVSTPLSMGSIIARRSTFCQRVVTHFDKHATPQPQRFQAT